MSKFGVGFSEITDSLLAGKRAAEDALHLNALDLSKIRLCFLFCTSRHDPYAFMEGVRSVVKDCLLFGGYANGTITNEHAGYDGFQVAVGILESDSIEVDLFMQEGIAFNEYNTGQALAMKIRQKPFLPDPQILLLFDAVNRQHGRFQMNYGFPFLKGMKEIFKDWPNIAGARLIGDMKFKPTFQWFGHEIVQNSALALVLTGNICMDVLVLQGCRPASAYHTITATKGATVMEIDNLPAVKFMIEMGGAALMKDYRQFKFFVTLGENLGDKWELNNTSSYVNRMCVDVDVENNGLEMSEMGLVAGSEFQLMRREFDMNEMEQRVKNFITETKSAEKSPIFALYFNCSGRASAYSENTEEDVNHIQLAVDNRFPLLGIYEAGELAKIGSELQVLDWAGIFCLFSQKNYK